MMVCIYRNEKAHTLCYLNNSSHTVKPDGSDCKESACNAGDLGLIPGLGDPLEKRKAMQYSIPGEFLDYVVHGIAKSQTQLRDFHNFQALHTVWLIASI